MVGGFERAQAKGYGFVGVGAGIGAIALSFDAASIASLRPFVVSALGLSVFVVVALGAAAEPQRHRVWAAVVAGVLVASLSLLEPRSAVRCIEAVLLGEASVALLPSWRGIERDLRRALVEVGIFVGVASFPLAATAVVSLRMGAPLAFADMCRGWILDGQPASAASLALPVLTIVLALDGAQAGRRQALLVFVCLVMAALGVLLARFAWIGSIASVPIEAFWSDGPFLVNALKLDAHATLYGPMEDLNSYTYSPLIDLLHHAILAPCGLELSLYANRGLTLLDQAAAAGILVWIVWPIVDALGPRSWARVWVLLAIPLVAFANLVAPAIHPDHPELVCVAIAFALVVGEGRWTRRAWWAALVLVTPLATAFKLSGEGIGLGLAAVFAYERRGSALAVVLGSMVMALATVPLFGAFLGRYAAYAIGVQSRGAFDWPRLVRLPCSPFGFATVLAGVYAIVVRSPLPRDESRRLVVRLALLSGGIGLLALPAYLKVSGRDNNLMPLLFGAALVVLVAAAAHATVAGPRWHPALPWALVLTFTLAARPLIWPLHGPERSGVIRDFEAMTTAVREDRRLGRRTLALLHTNPWIVAGRRDVPFDRCSSALELCYAHIPEGDLLSLRVADGRYDTILSGGVQLAPGADTRGQFNARLLSALRDGYDLVYPPGALEAWRVEGAVIYRKRAR
jgi:hypothetical protein